VAAPVVVDVVGAETAGAGFAGCDGCVPWAKAGSASSATSVEVARTRVNISVVLFDPVA
jgi:hypothetical protein